MSRAKGVKKSNDLWGQAIEFARKELKAASARAAELRAIIRNFEEAKRKGAVWPGTKDAGTSSESAPAKG